MTNIWQFQNRVSERLLNWGLFSTVLGFMMMRGNTFWRAVGWQFIGWGLIDALIALLGQTAAQSRIDSYPNPGLGEVKIKEAKNLRRLLWINAGLDVLYVLGGRSLIRRDSGDGARHGMGFGIVLQGAFLFFFDVYHALANPDDE